MRNRLALPQKPEGDPKGREKIQESQRGMRATRLKKENRLVQNRKQMLI